MSNSTLISYTKISPNCNKPRNHKIDKIVIHHMAGNMSAKACVDMFANPARQGSCNYAIGTDGAVALGVDEANRSWCSSSAEIDNRAITIEVANDSKEPNWHVSDKALASLINLCTDICQRNGIKKLNYTGDKSGNLHMHKWYAATACPGAYLGGKFGYIADEVNKRLGASSTSNNSTSSTKSYQVKVTCKSGLNVRTGAGVSNAIVKNVTAKYNTIYTIMEDKTVSGQKWGKLKSGAGWICLTGFTSKI